MPSGPKASPVNERSFRCWRLSQLELKLRPSGNSTSESTWMRLTQSSTNSTATGQGVGKVVAAEFVVVFARRGPFIADDVAAVRLGITEPAGGQGLLSWHAEFDGAEASLGHARCAVAGSLRGDVSLVPADGLGSILVMT